MRLVKSGKKTNLSYGKRETGERVRELYATLHILRARRSTSKKNKPLVFLAAGRSSVPPQFECHFVAVPGLRQAVPTRH
jgi:hypothetical protein